MIPRTRNSNRREKSWDDSKGNPKRADLWYTQRATSLDWSRVAENDRDVVTQREKSGTDKLHNMFEIVFAAVL